MTPSFCSISTLDVAKFAESATPNKALNVSLMLIVELEEKDRDSLKLSYILRWIYTNFIVKETST